MKIYTKTGDSGDTSLFGGKRVHKSSLRIEAYGTVDELNAQLGAVRSLKPDKEIDGVLEIIQERLFTLGADLAAPADPPAKIKRIGAENIKELEEMIDRFDSRLDQLRSFILPGGNQVSAGLHVARAVCRRGERRVDALGRTEQTGDAPLVFLNRLSDLLFVLARFECKRSGNQEIMWDGKE